MSDPELANRSGGFWANDIDEMLAEVFKDATGEINAEIYQRNILRQWQGMQERFLIGSGVAEKAAEALGIDMALRLVKSSKVFEMEIDDLKQGGVMTELIDCGNPLLPSGRHYTTLYFQHGEDPVRHNLHEGLFTAEEVISVYGHAQDLKALAESGQIAPSDDLTEHHRPLPEEPIY